MRPEGGVQPGPQEDLQSLLTAPGALGSSNIFFVLPPAGTLTPAGGAGCKMRAARAEAPSSSNPISKHMGGELASGKDAAQHVEQIGGPRKHELAPSAVKADERQREGR